MTVTCNMKRSLLYIFFLLGLFQSVHGHASIIKPCARFRASCSSLDNIPKGESDMGEDIRSPISSITAGTSMPFCRTSSEWIDVVDTIEAGSSYTVEFDPVSVSHSGGHCEFSISYDGGKTFVVLHQELRYCLVGKKPPALTNELGVSKYTFDIPSDLPSADRAIFAWTWVNASGNREFYMNCADVAVTGSTSKSYTGKKMTIVNYKGYPTVDEFNMDYEMGIEYYGDEDQVTVTSNGSSSSSSSNGKGGDSGTRNGNGGSNGSNSNSDSDSDSKSNGGPEDAKASEVVKKINVNDTDFDEEINSLDDEEFEKCDPDESDVVDSNIDEYEYVCDPNESEGGNGETDNNNDEYEYVCDDDEESSDDFEYVCDDDEESSPLPTSEDKVSASPSPTESSSSDPSSSSSESPSPSSMGNPVISSDEPQLVCDDIEEPDSDAYAFVGSLVDNMVQQGPSDSESFAAIVMSSSTTSDAESSDTASSTELPVESSPPAFTSPTSPASESFVLFEYSGQEELASPSSSANLGGGYGPGGYEENEQELNGLDSIAINWF